MHTGLTTLAAALAVVLATPWPGWSEPRVDRHLPTPALLERAVDRGRLDRATADLYLSYAFTDPTQVPARFTSSVPWEGTGALIELRRRLAAMSPGVRREGIREALAPADNCEGITAPAEVNTAHFHIHHPGVTNPPIQAFEASLESVWATEVDSFGWAAPPLPGTGRYLVVVAPLGALFGFVSPTTNAGNNPNTSWNEGDAWRSCMVLNSDFSALAPGQEQAALDATTSHEFNHSIQFGYGALSGANIPDYSFVEGMATWMEDEVFDGANDNYRYLWPEFTDDMGHYRNDDPLANPYAYWVIWRAMVEQYASGASGGGEQVFQDFWELISRNEAEGLEGLDQALSNRGTTLADAYHAAGIALKFNRPCGGGYVPPHCLEEGPAYVAARGPTPLHGQIGAIGQSVAGTILDNYALNWIGLPATAGPFQARLRNTSAGGRLKASVACDTGSGLVVRGFPEQAGPDETTVIRRFDPAGCVSVVAVIANVAQTEANPSTSAARPYNLSVQPPPQPTRTTLRVRRSGQEIVGKGTLVPPHPGMRMRVTLYERDHGRWDRIDTERPRLRGRRYRAEFDRPGATRCKMRARFPGDVDHLPSRRSKTFGC